MTNNLIFYIGIIILIFFFINRYRLTVNTLISIILSFIVIYYIIQYNKNSIEKYKNINNIKLNIINKILNNDDKIKKKSYLYLKPAIIEFYYNMIENSKYNFKNYKESLICTNQMIKLLYEMNYISIPFQNYDIIKFKYKESLNHYQSIIYSIPSDKISLYKFNKSLIILQSLLLNIVITAKNKCINRNNNIIDINTIPTSILENDTNYNDIDTITYSNNFSFY